MAINILFKLHDPRKYLYSYWEDVTARVSLLL